jgi:uncharacterized membrane protein
VEPWWYTIRYIREALVDGAATTFLFLVSLWVRIASSVMMTLLMNSGNVPLVLSDMCSYNLLETLIMKQSFFFSSVCTWFSPYCTRWLNSFE